MGNDIEDERAISEDQSKGSWELNRSIDERCSLALIMTVSNVIIIIIITIIIVIIIIIIITIIINLFGEGHHLGKGRK